MKSFATIQAVLGLSAALASNENGVYLNEEQMQALEDKLNEMQTSIDAAATLKTELEGKIEAAKGSDTVVGNAINALADKADAEKGATATETIANIEAKVVELQAEPGDQHTTAGAGKANEDDNWPSYADKNSSIYTQLN